jgi:hypothetical protein
MKQSSVASGVKVALFVCAVGFVALAANRTLVSPASHTAAETSPPRASMVAPDQPTPALRPSGDATLAAPLDSTGDAAQYENDDNHPSSF